MGSLIALLLAGSLVFAAAGAVAEEPPTPLVVDAGRPLRVALDSRTRLQHEGQPVLATLVEPVYAYDRVVIPVGAKVRGHIAKLVGVGRGPRVHAILGGDLTPLRRAVLVFDDVVMPGGAEIPIQSEVRSATRQLVLSARAPAHKSVLARAGGEVAGALGFDQTRKVLASIKQPGRLQRLEQSVVQKLPYHPQYLGAGTVYTASLLAPLSFGSVEAAPWAEVGTSPAPESILRARLLDALSSSRTPKGTVVRAALTAPLFSADHKLIAPEGTILSGEVTLARPAGRFHRNGQLRFIFESVQLPEGALAALRASLYSVQTGKADRIALDDEGGARATSSNTRFAAPALAGLALAAQMHEHADYDTDGVGPEVASGSSSGSGVGGYFGLGFLGAGLAQIARPFGVALGAIGFARTMYAAVAGKGRDVSFPADTVIEVQLAAAPAGPAP